MRYLKKKISLKLQQAGLVFPSPQGPEAQVKFELKQECDTSTTHQSSEKSSCSTPTKITENPSSKRGPRKTRTPANGDSKNIIKNYGKALCTFASSKIAIPYIKNIVKKMGCQSFNIPKFMDYFKQKKEPTNSIENIRSLLIEEDNDSEELKVFKRVFKEVSIIFMKYFAVNWIYGGKLVHKLVHLTFRFKMLRRVKHPELFTYLKTSPKDI